LQNHKKVIPFPGPTPPARWSFFDYVEGGDNQIESWYQNLSEEARDAFDALLKNTCKIELPIHWTGFKYLKGMPKEERIWQLDFIADKRQYRALGIFGRVRKQAVVILGCYHKGDVYTPQNALETARKRARALREGRADDPSERKIKSDI
jgi:phage-related protein